MKTFISPSFADWNEILQRPTLDSGSLDDRIRPVLEQVKHRGDQALLEFTAKFDGVSLQDLLVSEEEFADAKAKVSDSLKSAIDTARLNIEKFHLSQREEVKKIETTGGVVCWRKSIAIQKVGLYIPGGTAPLFSTILMLGVPAIIAGCEEIVLCTPPSKDGTVHPAILYTASSLGISKVVKVGGAQAIAAMAYGTASVPRVYKIFGPGNQYVTAAKQMVSQQGVAIDMPAGPSEVAVLADESANPAFVAADLLSQAEHGKDSQVILVTSTAEMVKKVEAAMGEQLKSLPRNELAMASLSNSKAIVAEDLLGTGMEIINAYAPEHLILQVGDPQAYAVKVVNAGSVFMGYYTPESAGDYASGTNHTLPTNGYARAYSGVSLDSFVKKVTFQQISKEGIAQLGPVIEEMAEAEQLHAHKLAVTLRLKEILKK